MLLILIARHFVASHILWHQVFYIPPPWPGLFLSSEPEFLERCKFFQYFLLEFFPEQILSESAYFSPDYCTAPVLSRQLIRRQ